MANGKIRPLAYQTFLTLLTGEQVEAIHRASLHILEGQGVHMPHARVQEILASCGARVDKGTARVYFPPHLVEEALAKAPRAFLLAARDPERDLPVDGRHGYLTLDGCGLKVADLETGAVRPSTKKDLEEAVRVADCLEQVAFLWPVVSAQDCPGEVQPLHELSALLHHSTKHAQAMTAVSPETARGSVEMAAAVAGGAGALRRRPLISNFQCSISPLAYDPAGLEAALIFAGAGIPTGFMNMTIGCSTAPATVAGNLAQGNAEVLAGITLIQCYRPGLPTFYGSCATVMELRSGGVACDGPEDLLLQAGAVQMARRYGLPSNAGTFATGAKTTDWYAGAAGALSASISAFTGADMLCGAGLMAGAVIFSFEQLVLDCEIFEILRRVAAGIPVNPEALALEAVARVENAGHYMTDPHTLAHLREIWQPMAVNRSPYPRWVEEGRPGPAEGARELARRILQTHRPEPLEPGLSRELEQIIQSYTQGGN